MDLSRQILKRSAIDWLEADGSRVFRLLPRAILQGSKINQVLAVSNHPLRCTSQNCVVNLYRVEISLEDKELDVIFKRYSEHRYSEHREGGTRCPIQKVDIKLCYFDSAQDRLIPIEEFLYEVDRKHFSSGRCNRIVTNYGFHNAFKPSSDGMKKINELINCSYALHCRLLPLVVFRPNGQALYVV